MTKGKRRKRKSDPVRPAPAATRPAGYIFGPRSTLICALLIVVVGLVFFNQIVFRGEILTGGDVLAGAAIFEDYANERMAAGELPLWNPYIFAGMPFFESMTWSAFVYPSFWVKYAVELIPGVTLPRLFFLFLHYLLAGLGMFFYLRSRKVGHGGALFGGLAYMLTPHLIGLASIGHGGKVLTSAYIPLVLLAAERLLDSGERRWIAVLGLVGGLQFLARHVQVSYYTWLAVAVLLVHHIVTAFRAGESARDLSIKTAKLVAAGVLAAAFAAVLLVPLREYSALSTRVAESGGMGFDQATMWSMHPKELLTFLVPSLFGLADRTYWGPMPFQQVSNYVGYVVLCFAVIGAAGRSRRTWFLVILAAVCVFLSFGKYITPVYRALYTALPGFSRFRVPALFLMLAQFALAALAGHGVSRLLGETGEGRRRWLPWAVGTASAGIVVALVVMAARSSISQTAANTLLAKFAGAQSSYVRDTAFQAARMAFRDAGILIAFSAATGVAIFVAGSRRLKLWMAAALLIGVALWDVSLVNARFMKPERMHSLNSYYPSNEAVRFLKRQEGPFRVAPIGSDVGSNAWMYHRIETIGGYHPAKLLVIEDLLSKVGLGNLKLLALLNVRYLVGPEALEHPALVTVAPGVHEFRGALPRVFLIGQVKRNQSQVIALGEYANDLFDPTRQANIVEELPGPVESVEGSSVRLVSHTPSEIEVSASIRRPCLLVFSEVYYPPGWKAFVDGSETEIYRTNYAFRSVYLEPGEHTVLMKHESRGLRTGLSVTLAAAIAILLLWAVPARVKS
ncbi:MAG: YfhO family protein [Candidatus Eisenbacteria bacterium]